MSAHTPFAITRPTLQSAEEKDVVPCLSVSEIAAHQQASQAQLREAMPTFRLRPAQAKMIDAVSQTIQQRQVISCQAGTGVGKTLGYLLGAAPYLIAGQHRLLISTYTVALQTQLIEKDLPLFVSAIKPELTVALAKGGERYFCPLRAATLLKREGKLVDQIELDLLGEDDDEQPLQGAAAEHKASEIDQINTLWQQFKQQTFDGDLDTLDEQYANTIPALVQRKRDRCPGAKMCPKGSECPFYLAREQVKQADIVVTNHALLANSLVRNPETFGSLKNHIVVVDEAHHFHDVFRNAMQQQVSLDDLINVPELVNKLVNLHSKLLNGKHALDAQGCELMSHATPDLAQAHKSAMTLAEAICDLQTLLQHNFNTLRGPAKNDYDNVNQWVLGFDALPAELARQLIGCLQQTKQTERHIQRYTNKTERYLNTVAPAKTKIGAKVRNTLYALADLAPPLNDLVRTFEPFIEVDELHTTEERIAAQQARWITRLPEQHGFELATGALQIGDVVQDALVDQVVSLIMTSATLEALGDMRFFSERLGFTKALGHQELKLSSDFDYSRVVCTAPLHMGDPNQAKHAMDIAHYLGEEVRHRHRAVLVLFCSQRQLEQTYNALPNALRRQILRQRDHSKRGLIDLHRQRIDKGETSILFGLDGLAEGLDLPGEYLTCVVITKLPFPQLNEPLLKYETMTLEACGRDTFAELTLPQCSQKLIQSVGRLIRTEQDYGEIVLLDSRVHTKRYAGNLLQALPMGHG